MSRGSSLPANFSIHDVGVFIPPSFPPEVPRRGCDEICLPVPRRREIVRAGLLAPLFARPKSFQCPASEHDDANGAHDQIGQHFQEVEHSGIHAVWRMAAQILFRRQCVQRRVQAQDVHTRLAEKTEAGGVGGHGRVGGQSVLRAVVGDALHNGVVQFLRRRAEIAAAGTGRVITVACRRGARMKKFAGGEGLAEQARAVNRAVLADDQTAVGLAGKRQLRDTENDERINPAADDRQHQRDHHGSADFRE
jgi:hypothetical protein